MTDRFRSLAARCRIPALVFLAGAVAGTAAGVFGRVCEARALSPGGGALDLAVVATGFWTTVLAALFTFALGPLFCLSRFARPAAILYMIGGLPFAVASVGTYARLPDLRPPHFERFAEQARPLVDAVRRYTLERGVPPPSLTALVPVYLERIPTTGFGAVREYEYEVRPQLVFHRPTYNSFTYIEAPWSDARPDWVLTVRLPFADPEALVCTPSEGQIFRHYGFQFETVGDWTLVRFD